MTFRTSLPIRFGHEDHARIVYFPRFLHFFHCAFEDFFAGNGIPYRESLETDQVGWPAVHVDVDFQSPLRFGDTFDVDVWVAEMGTKSAKFAYRGRCEGRAVATADGNEAPEAALRRRNAIGRARVERPACVGWRQTKSCDPAGARDSKYDRGCLDAIDGGWSGYCACRGPIAAKASACGHEEFTCAEACAAAGIRLDEALETLAKLPCPKKC